jgi:riboflavin synthase
MFTGLIEAVGTVSGLHVSAAGHELRIRTVLAPELRVGESVAVNGVCLTVTATGADEVCADIGPETARVTTLASLQRGRSVNVERSMRADGRFGGHFVQGHVDATGTIDRVRKGDCEVRWFTRALLRAQRICGGGWCQSHSCPARRL